MPPELHEEWLLIEEFVLFEGDRALLKLLRCVRHIPCKHAPPCRRQRA